MSSIPLTSPDLYVGARIFPDFTRRTSYQGLYAWLPTYPGPFSPLVAADTFLDALPAFSFPLPFVGRIVVLPTFAAFALLLSANGLWFSFLHPRGNPRVNHLHHSFITLSSLFA